MGIRDRPSEQPDVPDETGPAKGGGSSAEASPTWPNLDRLSDDALRSALPRNHPDRPVAKPEAPGKHAVEDDGQPDYDDPADFDYLSFDPRFERGQTVIVGKTGSPDNPKRYAEIRDDGEVVEIDTDDPLPDLPTGEDLGELDDDDQSMYGRGLEMAKRSDSIENLESAGNELGKAIDDWFGPTKPTGTIVGTPDAPVVNPAPREGIHGGELAIAPLATWLLLHYGIRSVRDRVEEFIQAREDRPDAGE